MGMHSSSDAFKYIESFTNLERSFTSAQTEYKLERMAYSLHAGSFRSPSMTGALAVSGMNAVQSAMAFSSL